MPCFGRDLCPLPAARKTGGSALHSVAMTVPPAAPGTRLLVIAPQPFYEDRGTPIAVKHLLEALSELGRDVDLLTYPVGKTVELPGLRTFRVRNPLGFRSVPIGFSLRKLVLDAVLLPAIVDRLRRERYQAIHALEEAAFPAVLAARKRRVPVVYDMQSSLPEQLQEHRVFCAPVMQGALRGCERWLVRNSDLVLCSVGLQTHVLRHDPAARVCEWIYPVRETPLSSADVRAVREELEIDSSCRVVMYSGNFASYQGLPNLLAAVPDIVSRAPNTRFVLVGADETVHGLPPHAEELRQQGVLRVVGRQPRERIPAYLQLADVLVSPRGNGRNLPLKVFDYMAAGKPIVATDSPTHRRVLDCGRAHLVGTSPRDLADGITLVLGDPDRCRRLGIAARSYYDKHLAWMHFLRFVASLYGSGEAGQAFDAPQAEDALRGSDAQIIPKVGAGLASSGLNP